MEILFNLNDKLKCALNEVSFHNNLICLSSIDEDNFYIWYEKFAKDNIEKYDANYKNVFITKSKGIPFRIAGLGFFIGFKIFISSKEMIVEVMVYDNTIFQECITFDNELVVMPYDKIFKCAAQVKNTFESVMGKADMPLIGGFKAETMSPELKEMVSFHLPQIVLYGAESRYKLFSLDADVVIPKISKDDFLRYEICGPVDIEYIPNKSKYLSGLDRIIYDLKKNENGKVVSSRKCVLKTNGDVNSVRYIQSLHNDFFQAYTYLFVRDKETWIGISPEVLITTNKNLATTKPLAGTIKRTGNDEIDKCSINELLENPKEDIEHFRALQLMIEDLKNSDVGDVSVKDEKQIVKTPYVFHLKSQIDIVLNENINLFDILEKIYPPATIWGIPRHVAEGCIKQTEPFRREYFTGGFGYFNLNGDSDIALVIRTAKIVADQIHLYAGSGIVESAKSNLEWDETALKMSPFISYIKTSNICG